jgi:hypothetical protein
MAHEWVYMTSNLRKKAHYKAIELSEQKKNFKALLVQRMEEQNPPQDKSCLVLT